MANTAEKNNRKTKVKKKKDFVSTFILSLLKLISILFIVLIILFFWTEDLYDYNNWNYELFFQIVAFTGILAGFLMFFFKPNLSGWVILFSSVSFWFVTAIIRGLLWLGPLFLVFPLIGILILVLNKLNKQKLYS